MGSFWGTAVGVAAGGPTGEIVGNAGKCCTEHRPDGSGITRGWNC